MAETDSATPTGASTATVGGLVNPSGQSTNYAVQYGPSSSTWCTSHGSSGSPASTTGAQTLGSTDDGSHDVSVTLSGLTGGQGYCVQLIATNASGTSQGGQVTFTAGAPSAETDDATATGPSAATVSGLVNPAGQTTTYAVQYDVASSTWCINGGYSGSPASTTGSQTLGSTDDSSHHVSVTLSGLTAGQSYCAQLIASNGSGAAQGGVVSFTAGAPLAQTNDAEATGATTATVDGSINPAGQTTTYAVQYGSASSSWCTSGGSSGTPGSTTSTQTLGFTDNSSHDVSVPLSGLTAGQSYCAQLIATNPVGTSQGGQLSFAAGLPSANTADASYTGATTANVDGSVNPPAGAPRTRSSTTSRARTGARRLDNSGRRVTRPRRRRSATPTVPLTP